MRNDMRHFLEQRESFRDIFLDIITRGCTNEAYTRELKWFMTRTFTPKKEDWFGEEGQRNFFGIVENLPIDMFEDCFKIVSIDFLNKQLGTLDMRDSFNLLDVYKLIKDLKLTHYPYSVIKKLITLRLSGDYNNPLFDKLLTLTKER